MANVSRAVSKVTKMRSVRKTPRVAVGQVLQGGLAVAPGCTDASSAPEASGKQARPLNGGGMVVTHNGGRGGVVARTAISRLASRRSSSWFRCLSGFGPKEHREERSWSWNRWSRSKRGCRYQRLSFRWRLEKSYQSRTTRLIIERAPGGRKC